MLGDQEVTANIYCKSRNLPNTDTQNYSTDLRYNFWVTQYMCMLYKDDASLYTRTTYGFIPVVVLNSVEEIPDTNNST